MSISGLAVSEAITSFAVLHVNSRGHYWGNQMTTPQKYQPKEKVDKIINKSHKNKLECK